MKMSPSTRVALAAVGALDPPGGVGRDLDRGAADDVAELPVGAAAVVLDVELRRQPEVALATGGEADVGADARDAERADVVAVEIVADHVPRAVLGQQRVRVERALALLVARDRPVAELDRPLLRDRAFELAEAALQLGRVVGVAHLDPAGGAGRRGGERARPSGRAPGSAARGAAARRRRSGPRAGRSTSGARRALRRRARARGRKYRSARRVYSSSPVNSSRCESSGTPSADELGAVGVEAARERLVAHLLVALDVRLDVPRRQRPALRHQERDQRELADQLVGVVAHRVVCGRLRGARADDGEPTAGTYAAALLRSRC